MGLVDFILCCVGLPMNLPANSFSCTTLESRGIQILRLPELLFSHTPSFCSSGGLCPNIGYLDRKDQDPTSVQYIFKRRL